MNKASKENIQRLYDEGLIDEGTYQELIGALDFQAEHQNLPAELRSSFSKAQSVEGRASEAITAHAPQSNPRKVVASIRKLDFGHSSAESEVDILPAVFVRTAFFERIRKFKKWLVLGRKGSGKTAARLMLFRQLQEQNKVVTTITPGSLSAAKAALLEKSSLNQQEAAVLKWKYVFLVELCRYIVHFAEEQIGSSYRKWPENIQQLRTFLVQFGEDEGNSLDKAIKFARSIKKVAVSAMKVEGSLELDSSPAIDFVDDDLDMIMIATQEAMSILLNDPIYILIDEVDDLWDSTETGYELIVGLLKAAKEINDKLPLAKIAVFLRSDIFDYLQFDNQDHYWTHIELITWTADDLKKLLALRIRNSTSVRARDVNSIWESVFPTRIGQQESFEFVASYTLMRPRDFILLCALCRDGAQNRNASSIEEKDIRKALTEYSRRQVEGLTSEYRFQYPFLQALLLRVFYDLKTPYLPYEYIQDNLAPYKERFVEEYGKAYFEPISTLFQILYTVGFLGVITSDRILYESKGDKFLLPYASKLAIHPAFRAGLLIPADHDKYTVQLTGEGAVAIGEGAVAIGQRGVMVSGKIGGSVITGSIHTGSGNVVIGDKVMGDQMKGEYDPAYLLGILAEKVLQYFSLDELKESSFDLEIDYDSDLVGGSKHEKVLGLIKYLEAQGRIPEFLAYLQKERPKVIWTEGIRSSDAE